MKHFIRRRFNPNHRPAGDERGGEFTSASDADFSAWFEGSKVVDADGKPLIVYHGTNATFDKFDATKIGSAYGVDQQGFYFTSSEYEAQRWADEAPNPTDPHVLSVYLAIKNPWQIDVPDDRSPVAYFESGEDVFDRGQDNAIAYGISSGYDGMIIRGESETLFVAFNPEQIKITTQKFNPNHRPAGDERGGEFTSAPLPPETNGEAPKVGDTFLVYRAGSPEGKTLEHRNAGNARGVAYHLTNIDDDEGPQYKNQPVTSQVLAIHAFKVTLTEPVSGYRMYNGGDSVAGDLGNDVTRVGYKATEHYGDVFAFGSTGRGYTAEYLGSVPTSDVLAELNAGTSEGRDNFDYWGVNKSEEAIRKVVKAHLLAKKFNPNHKPAGSPEGGQFTYAITLAVETPAKMMALMEHLSTQPGYHPNIIDLSVAGTQIFHPDKSLGIARIDMPQVPSKHRDAFLATLPKHDTIDVDPRDLNPVQNELDGHKVSLFATGKNLRDIIPVVSRDGWVVDGHHNWAGAVARAVVDPKVKLTVHRVDMDHATLLQATRDYAAEHGFEAKELHKASEDQLPDHAQRFNPNHVPAGSPEGGQFTSGGEFAPKPVDFNAVFGDGSRDSVEWEKRNGTVEANTFHEELADAHVKYRRGELTGDQLTALNDYRDNGYRALNSYLRHGLNPQGLPPRGHSDLIPPDGTPQERELAFKNYSTSLSGAIAGAPGHSDLTVWRSFRSDELTTRAEDLIGQTFTDPGFMSTSLSSLMAGNWVRTRLSQPGVIALRLRVPAAVKALYLPQNIYEPYEYEVLLDKATTFKVSKVTPFTQGGYLIDAEVVAPVTKFNPNHKPAGSPEGGQFTSDSDGEPINTLDFESVFDPTPNTDVSPFERFITPEAAELDDDLLDETQQHYKSLTKAERSALESYSYTDYRAMNRALRLQGVPGTGANGDGAHIDFEHPKNLTQELIVAVAHAIDTAPPLPGVKVYRAFRSLPLSTNAEDLVGKTFIEKGFMSTSASTKFVGNWGGGRDYDPTFVALRLTVPRGSAKGIYIPENSAGTKEYEVVLQHGTAFRVDSVQRFMTGGALIDATVVPAAQKFNPHHYGPGPKGGQFAPAPLSSDLDGDGQGDLALEGGHAVDKEFDYETLQIESAHIHGTVHDMLASDHLQIRKNLSPGERYALNMYQSDAYAHMNWLAANWSDLDEVMAAIGDPDSFVAKQVRAGMRQMDEYSNSVYDDDHAAVVESAARLDHALDRAPHLPDDLTLYRVFRNKDLASNAILRVGTTLRDPRFLSTSADSNNAYKWGEERVGPDLVVMRLTTKNAKGLYLTSGPDTLHSWEHEVLFDRNTPITITNVKPIAHHGGVLVEGIIGNDK